MSHGKNGQHKTGNTMLANKTYTAIKVGEQAGVSTVVEKVLGRPAMSLVEVVKSSLSQ